LNGPFGICLDAAGNLLIADTGDNRIRKVANGVITTIAGTGTAGSIGDGGPAAMAQLNGPKGVSVDAQNNIYIADTGNGLIRRVDAAGNISTIAGDGNAFSGDGGPVLAAGLGSPTCAILDSNGYLYIAEQSDNRVRKAGAGAPAKITN